MKSIYSKPAWPINEYAGQDFSHEEVLTVPDEDMSLQEIIERFTRGEALPQGFPTSYYEGEDDIEKLQHLDIVDKRAYVEKMQTVLDQFDKEEQSRKELVLKQERSKFLKKEEAKIRAKIKAEEDSAKSKV